MTGFFSQKQLIKLTGEKIILPFYHSVNDNIPDHLMHLYEPKTIHDFENDLDYLVKHFEPISLQELINIKRTGRKIDKPCFHLTFDDGLRECYDIIMPILIKRKIPATFFINTDFIDNKGLFYRFKASILSEQFSAKGMLDLQYQDVKDIDSLATTLGRDFDKYLEKEKPYLTTSQIKEMIDNGFTIGAHSKSHPLFNLISKEEQIQETLSSIEFVKEKFDLKYSVFSFPFTDDGVSLSFFKSIKNKVDYTFGSAGVKADSVKFNLQRIPMEQNESAELIIKTQYLYCLFKKIAGKNRILRR